MSTITLDEERKIATWLEEHPVLTVGVGTKEKACSIAAINLAMTGTLTDQIPECMSPVIGRWIIRIQDMMPADIRNSPEWRALLPRAAGSGRDHEKERSAIILDWMWSVVLPSLQPIADKQGFGPHWLAMTTDRTRKAAAAAAAAADAAAAAADARWAAAAAARWAAAADAARWAAAAAAAAADAAAASAADAARWAAAADAAAARWAAAADAAAARWAAAAAAAARREAWATFDPCALLARLVAVTESGGSSNG